ncbi:unnamed protein product, partial [Cyprideis torosa]
FRHDIASDENSIGIGIPSRKGTNERDAAVLKGMKVVEQQEYNRLLELEQGDPFDEQLQVGTFALGVVSVADELLQSP